ncbi:unnamed protein product, partial [Discosporangium mesarthrocarpum]
MAAFHEPSEELVGPAAEGTVNQENPEAVVNNASIQEEEDVAFSTKENAFGLPYPPTGSYLGARGTRQQSPTLARRVSATDTDHVRRVSLKNENATWLQKKLYRGTKVSWPRELYLTIVGCHVYPAVGETDPAGGGEGLEAFATEGGQWYEDPASGGEGDGADGAGTSSVSSSSVSSSSVSSSSVSSSSVSSSSVSSSSVSSSSVSSSSLSLVSSSGEAMAVSLLAPSGRGLCVRIHNKTTRQDVETRSFPWRQQALGWGQRRLRPSPEEAGVQAEESFIVTCQGPHDRIAFSLYETLDTTPGLGRRDCRSGQWQQSDKG